MAFPAKTDRAQILSAALEHLERDGRRKLSLRSLASSLGLVPNALYRYFADKSQLDAALSTEVTTQVHAVLEKATRRREPEAAIRSMARAYLDFAKRHPFLYEAWMAPCVETSDSQSAHDALWAFVMSKVTPVCGEKQAAEAATMLWAFLHGFAQLELAGVFKQGKGRGSFEWGLMAWLSAAKNDSKSAPSKVFA